MARWLDCAGKGIARAVLAALILAQLILSAQACMMPAMARQTAFSLEAMPEGCGSLSKNACLAQWTTDGQAVGSLQPAGPLAAAPPQHRPLPLAPIAAGKGLYSFGLDRETGPPCRTCYCRYLK